ncbi:MAG: hypothetical protein ACLGPL_09850, partial [Acidobacteriota bacterium]
MSLFPSWIEHRPMVEAVRLELSLPCLDDNTADLDRLTRGLAQRGFTPLHVPPSGMGRLIEHIRLGSFNVTALVGKNGPYWELVDLLPGFTDGPVLGFAVDLGSSSLAFYLIDLRAGKILAQRSAPNPQIPFGDDILTRILFARTEPNRKLLQRILVKAMNESMVSMLEERGLGAENVLAMTVAGNTAMSHFFLGLDPGSICKEPYIPAANRF